MKKLVSLIAAAMLLVTALCSVMILTSADEAQGQGNGYHYNEAGEPVMDFVDPADGAQVGTWWWYSDDAEKTETRDMYLDFLEENGVNEIYYYGYYYLQRNTQRAKLHTFVEEANKRGMAVSLIYDDSETLLGSSRTLSTMCNEYLQYVEEYPEDKMNGFHFDVEHQSPQNFANKMVSQFPAARERGVPISMDVNCAMNIGTQVSAGGVTGNIYEVIAANVDTLTLMSYKDSFANIWTLGKNALAAAKAKGCRVVFGVETGDYSTGVAPHYETFNSPSDEFAQEDKEYMYGELKKVYDELKKDPPAGGIGVAVHQHRDWYSLKKSDTPITIPQTQPTSGPTKPKGPLETKVLWEGNVDQTVNIGQPTPYIGKLTGDVAAAINEAIRADIRENGPIVEGEYYEITEVASVRGDSGYCTTGLLVGDECQIWTVVTDEDCSVITKQEGAHTQRLLGGTTDKLGREVLTDKLDDTTELVFLSDSNGEWKDVCTVKSLKISARRYGEYVEPTGVDPTGVDPTGADPTATGVGALVGDANNDGAVNMKDVLAMRKYIAGMDTEINATAADVNGDGAVNMKDVLVVRKYLAGLGDLGEADIVKPYPVKIPTIM